MPSQVSKQVVIDVSDDFPARTQLTADAFMASFPTSDKARRTNNDISGRSTAIHVESSEVLLRQGEFLPATQHKRHRVDDVTDDFARGMASSLSEPTL